MSQNTNSDFTLADKIVFLFGLLLVVTSYFYFWQTTPAAYATIKSPQDTVLQINLDHKETYSVQGALGVSTIQVAHGKIRFTGSPCQNKFCIQHGWQQHHGDLTACLPNRVSIQLASLSKSASYDAINF